MSTRKFIIFCALFYIIIYALLYSYKAPQTVQQSEDPTTEEEADDGRTHISKDEAIKYDWDEIKQFIEGEEKIEVCNSDLDNCYLLEVTIRGGDVQKVYFPNGGHIELTAELDNNGEAEAYDDGRGYLWSFKINMNSSLIENAIEGWSKLNDYIIE